MPLLAGGAALAPHATAMMDVSDGLLLDLSRLIAASGCGAEVDLDALPLSRAFIAERGGDRSARLFAATGGDDYALLAALPPDLDPFNPLFTFRAQHRLHRVSRRRRRLSPSPTTMARFRCRSIWVMNIAHLSLRQWTIALVGLASGMATALSDSLGLHAALPAAI